MKKAAVAFASSSSIAAAASGVGAGRSGGLRNLAGSKWASKRHGGAGGGAPGIIPLLAPPMPGRPLPVLAHHQRRPRTRTAGSSHWQSGVTTSPGGGATSSAQRSAAHHQRPRAHAAGSPQRQGRRRGRQAHRGDGERRDDAWWSRPTRIDADRIRSSVSSCCFWACLRSRPPTRRPP